MAYFSGIGVHKDGFQVAHEQRVHVQLLAQAVHGNESEMEIEFAGLEELLRYCAALGSFLPPSVKMLHCTHMSAVLECEAPRPLSAEDLFQFWLRHANEFMSWQKENFIAREATPEELEEHGKRLDLMIGLTLHVYSVASKSMPEVLRTITGRLRQFEDSRTLVHNPMTQEESDAILERVFPDEPGLSGPS